MNWPGGHQRRGGHDDGLCARSPPAVGRPQRRSRSCWPWSAQGARRPGVPRPQAAVSVRWRQAPRRRSAPTGGGTYAAFCGAGSGCPGGGVPAALRRPMHLPQIAAGARRCSSAAANSPAATGWGSTAGAVPTAGMDLPPGGGDPKNGQAILGRVRQVAQPGMLRPASRLDHLQRGHHLPGLTVEQSRAADRPLQ